MHLTAKRGVVTVAAALAVLAGSAATASAAACPPDGPSHHARHGKVGEVARMDGRHHHHHLAPGNGKREHRVLHKFRKFRAGEAPRTLGGA